MTRFCPRRFAKKKKCEADLNQLIRHFFSVDKRKVWSNPLESATEAKYPKERKRVVRCRLHVDSAGGWKNVGRERKYGRS